LMTAQNLQDSTNSKNWGQVSTRNSTNKHNINWGVAACGMSLLAILATGTIGYHVIERWTWLDSLYMTVITVSTVGYGELYPLTEAGRLFTIILIVVGVGTVAMAISIIFKTIFQHQMKLFMEKRSMQKEVNSISKHIIICGYGRMGSNIAAALIGAGKAVVVIEHNPQLADEIERDGFLVVTGDASEDATLQQAGIERAVSLVATLGSDADNLFLTLTARGLNSNLDIIARTEDDRNCRKFTQAGASRVVSPLTTGSNRIIRLLTRPDVIDFVELMSQGNEVQLEISKINVDDSSSFANKTLSEGNVRQEVGGMVLAIQKATGQVIFDPPADSLLEVDDTLVVVGATK